MKRIITGLALAGLSLGLAHAAPAPQSVEESVNIAAPPARVWAIVQNFNDMSWVPPIKATTATRGNEPGSTRTLDLGGPKPQQLLGVVPLVQRLGGVEPLVALQPDELPAEHVGQHPGDLGLAHAGLALEQQWPPQGDAEADCGEQSVVGEVPTFDELTVERVVVDQHQVAGSPAPSSSRPRRIDSG